MPLAAKSDKRDPIEDRRLAEIGRIRDRLTRAKIKLTDIDKTYDLPAGTAGNAVHEPNLAGERAIAAALKTRPHLLWRTRYHSDGQRFAPQPTVNYRHARRAEASQAAA